MEKKPHLMAIVLFLTGLICIGLLFGLSYKTYRKIDTVDQKMASVIKPVQQKQKSNFIQLRSKRNRQPTNTCNSGHRQKKLSKTAPESTNGRRNPKTARKQPNLPFSVKPAAKDSRMAVMTPHLLLPTAISSGLIPDIRAKMLI